jgi:hypothetical protein
MTTMTERAMTLEQEIRQYRSLTDQLDWWRGSIAEAADIYEDTADLGDTTYEGGCIVATERAVNIRNECVTIDRPGDGIIPEQIGFVRCGVQFTAKLTQATSHECMFDVEEVC